FLHLRMIKSLGRKDRIPTEASRFRCRVGVKRCSLDVSAPGPESRADYFVRVGLARDGIGPLALRCTAARKAGHRQIKASPEKMHRTRLPDECRPKLFEH